MTPLLSVRDLSVRYGEIAAVRGVSLQISAGERVALAGANGAGKSTLLRALMGLVPARGGAIVFEGAAITDLSADRRAARGIGYVPEGRRVFAGLSVRENLEVACPAAPPERRRRVDDMFALFPRLAERAGVRAWQISGGEQQMLAIGRALMGAPSLLLLDEPFLGLAPRLRADIDARLGAIAARGTALLLADQNVAAALAHGDRAYLMRTGEIVGHGPSDRLREDPALKSQLLGL